jgi:hypothetical protein
MTLYIQGFKERLCQRLCYTTTVARLIHNRKRIINRKKVGNSEKFTQWFRSKQFSHFWCFLSLSVVYYTKWLKFCKYITKFQNPKTDDFMKSMKINWYRDIKNGAKQTMIQNQNKWLYDNLYHLEVLNYIFWNSHILN